MKLYATVTFQYLKGLKINLTRTLYLYISFNVPMHMPVCDEFTSPN